MKAGMVKAKHYFCTASGRYGAQLYGDDLEPGWQLQKIDYAESLPNDFEKNEDLNSTYFFLTMPQKLYFTRQGLIEEVLIEDMERFLRELDICLNQDNRVYSIKHLTPEEVHTLITSNGGHRPESDFIVEKLLIPSHFMADLFPRVNLADESSSSSNIPNP